MSEHSEPNGAEGSRTLDLCVAPPAAKPIEKGLPGPDLLTAMMTGKYSDHLPLNRLEDVFFRSGVKLARSTLSRWAIAVADLVCLMFRKLSIRS